MSKQLIRNVLLCTIICLHQSGTNAQQSCTGHPLFSTMSGHSVRYCETKEFDELDLQQSDKVKGSVYIKKQGAYIKVTYKFDGDWNQRPSALQVIQNYSNALQKNGGEILYKSSGNMHGKLKKGDATYWIAVMADGSGDYSVRSVKEEKMKQDVVLTADDIKNSIKEDGKAVFYGIYFDTDKATLKPESSPTLTEIAKFLKANPSTNVFVVGHTDNTGNYNHNMQLSRERAASVINELAGKYGVNKSQLNAEGVGPLSPVAANNTEAGKQKNRRVEIVVK